MKQTFTALVISFCTLNLFSQNLLCGCDKLEINSENHYICDTTLFSNGAKIYWQWDCDSAWLIFENKEKIILKSCYETDVYECDRTGLIFLKEYPNYLLFQYKWISGCCTSPDIVFINKLTGNEIKRIPKDQFVWGDTDDDYVLYFSDTTFTKLIYMDNNTDSQYNIAFNKDQVTKSIVKYNIIQFTDIFEQFKKYDNFFVFNFKTAEGKFEKIKIELK